MNGAVQDLRYAVRQLRKSGVHGSSVIALALGIASTTAIFSVVDVVLLHPLPQSGIGSHCRYLSDQPAGRVELRSAPANYLDWVAQNHVFSVMAAGRGWQGNLAEGDRPESVRVTMTTASFSYLGLSHLSGAASLPKMNKPVTTMWLCFQS
jgi:hypothetical protein